MSDGPSARAEELFHAALELPPLDRERLLQDACVGDVALRRDVDVLLANYERASAGFLDQPVFRMPEDGLDTPVTIGSYRVLRPIGEGGMGLVYEAEQDGPRRAVAVKVLRPGLYARHQLRRFELECEVLGQLTHPGIARVYDAGTATVTYAGGHRAELPYLAMELIRGRSLLDHAESASLPVESRLRLFARVCDAVHYAHQQAIIHRDLKPTNILVDDRGQPKILDFGVARVVDEHATRTRHTRTGDVVGTLRYMSPEQLLGTSPDVDLRSDVYTLGVILYELLTSRSPYEAETATTTIAEMLRRVDAGDVPRPSACDRSLRGDPDAIVLTAMAVDPAERYPTAAALAEDVRRFLDGAPIAARGDRGWYALRRLVRRHRRTVAVSVAFVTLVLASTVLAWSLYTQSLRAQRVADRERQEATERLWESYLSGAETERATQRAGRRGRSLDLLGSAAAIRPGPEVRDGVIASMAISDVELLSTMPRDGIVSARGLAGVDRLATASSDGRIRVLDLPDLNERVSVQGPPHTAYVVAFSHDGRYLAAKHHPAAFEQSEVRVWVWDLDGPAPILRLDEGEVVRNAITMGRTEGIGPWAAFGEIDGAVHLYRLDPPGPWLSFSPTFAPAFLEFDPVLGRLAAASGAGEVEIWDVARRERILAHQLATRLSALGWSRESRLVVGTPSGEVYEWDPESRAVQRQFVGHQGWIGNLFLSPDNELLVTESWDATTRLWDFRTAGEIVAPLHAEDVEGVGRYVTTTSADEVKVYRYEPSLACRRLYAGAPFLMRPTMVEAARDGRHVVTATSNGGLQIWDLEAGRLIETVSPDPHRFGAFAGPGDDRLVAFDGGALSVWRVAWSGGAPHPSDHRVLWTRAGAHDGNVALDASEARVIVTSPEEIAVIDLATGDRIRTLPGYPGVSAPALATGGRLAFTGVWRRNDARLIDLDSGDTIASFAGHSVAGTFTPDGNTLVVCAEESLSRYDAPDWHRTFRVEDNGRDLAAARPVIAPDGRTLALPGTHDVRLYDLATGARLATLEPGDRSFVSAACFGSSQATVVNLTQQGVIMTWDVARIRARLSELGLDWSL